RACCDQHRCGQSRRRRIRPTRNRLGRGPTPERYRRAPPRACRALLDEPAQYFVERAGYAHDVPTMELDHRFIVALVGIVNDRDRLLPDGVTSTVDPGDQDESARDALPLHGHFVSQSCETRSFWSTEHYENICEATMVFFAFPEDAHWNDERAAVEFSV